MANKGQYTEEDKYKAVVLYYLHHNYKEVSRQLDIPYMTIRTWGDTQWWADTMAEVIKEFRAKIRGRGHELIDLAIAAVKDRLENGDVVIDKRNEQVRKPVALKDALLVSLTWLDKTMKIDAEEGFIKENPAVLKDIVRDLEAIGKRVGGKEAGIIEDAKEHLIRDLPDLGGPKPDVSTADRPRTSEPSQNS